MEGTEIDWKGWKTETTPYVALASLGVWVGLGHGWGFFFFLSMSACGWSLLGSFSFFLS